MDAERAKSCIKEVCKGNENIPSPGDVIVTKAGQVILKVMNKKDADKLQEVLKEDDTLKETMRVSIPVRRRERILLLSVDPEVEESKITESVNRAVEEMTPEIGLSSGLINRLMDPGLGSPTRRIIENIRMENVGDVRIVRKINTRARRVNWLLDTDLKTSEKLLARKRICVDFERYRIVQHVAIVRCFRCQRYGHMSGRCQETQVCAKCSEEHRTADCKSSKVQCSNCYFRDPSSDIDHRADGIDCPVFKEYRLSCLPKRL